MGTNTPFFDAIEELAGLQHRFFVPGHKGSADAAPPFGPVLRYDLTEIPGADDLSRPTGPLAQSEANMTRVYGSGATLYSASGASSCVMAMLALFTKPGGRVLMLRGCHASAVRALVHLGAAPVWLPPRAGRLTPETLAAALEEYPGAPVFVTSPDYYGRMSDIRALAALCRAAGSALLVDNAQGAHLRFCGEAAFEAGREAGDDWLEADSAGVHPISLGADAAADSAHKTLPCLTPAALLHLRDASLAPAARRALNQFCSTSPSYPVLASLDLAAGALLDDPAGFSAALARTAGRLAAVAAAAPHLVWREGNTAEDCILPQSAPAVARQAGTPERPTGGRTERSVLGQGRAIADPLRLCLLPAAAGWPTVEVEQALLAAGLPPEYADGTRIVLMASPYNHLSDFDALAAVLSLFAQKPALQYEKAPPQLALWPAACGLQADAWQAGPHGRLGTGRAEDDIFWQGMAASAACSPRDAVMGDTERVPLATAVGRVLAEVACPCPPGVPPLVPGEVVSEEAARLFAAGGIPALDVLK